MILCQRHISLAAIVLGLAAGVTPLLGLLAPLGFAPLFIAVTLVAGAVTWRQRVWLQLSKPLLMMTCAVVAWAALSAFWAVDPLRSLRSTVVLAAMTLSGLWLMAIANRLERADRAFIMRCLTIGIAVGLLYSLQDIVLGGVVTAWVKKLPTNLPADQITFLARQQLSRGIIAMALLSWVVAALLWRRPLLAIALLAITGGVVFWSWSAASKLALLMGLVAAALASWRYLSRLAQVVLVALVVMVPLAAQQLPGPAETATWKFMPFTNHHRLTIWRFTSQKIAEKPILGWGMDSARDMPGGEDVSVIWVGSLEVPEQLLPLHPHNGILQIWLELGAVGAILISGWLILASRMAFRQRPDRSFFQRAIGPAVFSGTVIVGLVSFGFWQSWWQSFLWLLVAWSTIARNHADQG